MLRATGIVLIVLILSAAAPGPRGWAGDGAPALPERLTPADAYAWMHERDLLLVDVRTPQEWRYSGVPAGAVAINLSDPGGALGFATKVLDAVRGDRSRPVAAICYTNQRSQMAKRVLEYAGFQEVAYVVEGVMRSPAGPGWIGRGLPVEVCAGC